MILSKGGIDYRAALEMTEDELWARYIGLSEAHGGKGSHWDWDRWELFVPDRSPRQKRRRYARNDDPTLPLTA